MDEEPMSARAIVQRRDSLGLQRRDSLGPQAKNSRQRRPSFCQTEISLDSKSTLSLMTGLPPGGQKLSVVHTWKPGTANVDKTERKNTKNVIDKKTLYSIKREHIASRELHFVNKPPEHVTSTGNVEHLVEKNYILSSRLSNATPEKFPKVIMKRFYRMSSPDQAMSYGMPRPPTQEKSAFNKVMDGIKREPSVVHLDQFPSLQEPVHCDGSDEFCEILGPSACQECIENTNRFIGEQLQHMSFPTIDMTPDKLILPKLEKLLTKGHKLQVRKRRMTELNLDFPDELSQMSRKESCLTSSSCLKCKKTIRHLKLKGKGRRQPNTARI